MGDVRANKIGETHLVVGEVIDENGARVVTKTIFTRVSSSGDNTFIAAVGGKKIRVLAYRIQAQGTVDVKFQDTAGSPAQLSQLWSFQAREGCVCTAAAGGFEFESPTGNGVEINLSAAVNTDVSAVYIEV